MINYLGLGKKRQIYCVPVNGVLHLSRDLPLVIPGIVPQKDMFIAQDE